MLTAADLFSLTVNNHNLQCRIAWEAGDLVMWSNSAVQRAFACFRLPGR